MSTRAIAGVILAAIAATAAATPKRVVWRLDPIDVTLAVGDERRVDFPTPVKLIRPADLRGKLEATLVGAVAHLKATQPFGTTRLRAESLSTDRVYLLDVHAPREADHTPAALVITDPELDLDPDSASTDGPADDPRVVLTRYAAQRFYAPKRLWRELDGVIATHVPDRAVPLYRGGAVDLQPVAAWRYGGLHCVAFRARNVGSRGRAFDPRRVRGEWVAAVAQRNWLAGDGPRAETMVYLIATQPYRDVVAHLTEPAETGG